MKKGIFLIFVVLLFGQLSTSERNVFKAEKTRLDNILANSTYDPNIRPQAVNGSGPVQVKVNIFLRSISEMDDVKMEYSVQLTFRQAWNDDRLKHSKIEGRNYLTLSNPERIWRPDVFFSNEKSGQFHNIVMPNVLIRISPNGDILYSTRISLKLSCPMDLRNYPMDMQECQIMLASYGYTSDDIAFIWKAGDPVQITKNLHLPRFTLKSFITDYCTSRTNTGEYSCLKVTLKLSRQFSYYLFQVYVPSIVLVLLSWIAFWLDYKATAARVAIWVTVLLTLTIKTAGINSKLPAVSYSKAIDVWTGSCLMFIFAVILELAYVMHCVTTEEREKSESNISNDDTMNKKHALDHSNQETSKSRLGFIRRTLNRYSSGAQRIDVICRIFFPVAFAFFNLVYWSTYSQTVNLEGTRYS